MVGDGNLMICCHILVLPFPAKSLPSKNEKPFIAKKMPPYPITAKKVPRKNQQLYTAEKLPSHRISAQIIPTYRITFQTIPPYHTTAKTFSAYKAQPCRLTACVLEVKWLTQQGSSHLHGPTGFSKLFLESIHNITEGLSTQDGT